MQDRYAGDVGDYGKFILLRHFARHSKLSIGIVWHAVDGKSEKTGDGKHIAYHGYSGKHCIKTCDSDLFNGLKAIADEERRSISSLEELLKKLLPNICFFNEFCTKSDRKNWNAAALKAMCGVDLVFFDPDNGICKDDCIPNKQSHRHVYLDELKHYWKRDQSLMVYHHLSRNDNHKNQIATIRATLGNKLDNADVITYPMRRGSSRTFLLVIHPKHAHVLKRNIDCESFKPLRYTKSEWIKEKE